MNETNAERSDNGQVERELAELEETFRTKQAGLMELLETYGGYEASLRQAEQYLGVLNPIPQFSSTDSTS